MNRFFRHIINWWKIKFRLKKGDHFSCRLNYIYNLMRDLTYGERLMSTIRRRQRRRQCQTMHILHMLHTLHYTYARAQSNVVHVVRNLLFNVIYCRQSLYTVIVRPFSYYSSFFRVARVVHRRRIPHPIDCCYGVKHRTYEAN